MKKMDSETRDVTQIYGALAAAIILSCVPMVMTQSLALILFLAAIITAYVLRVRTETGSLTDNHMTYLIRTFWIFSLLFLIGMAVAAWYLTTELDLYRLQGILEVLISDQPTMTADIWLLTYTTLLTLGPGFVYFIYRLARGITRAIKGYRMPNPKSWL